MHRLIKEMLSAQHLLYVSLKYAKTCDVILNLLQRWQNMVSFGIDALLEKAKKKKLVSVIPTAPKPKVEMLEKVFKKEAVIMETLKLYTFFRTIGQSEIIREHEFRKNVTLRIIKGSEEMAIDMEKLKQWQELFEKFVTFVRSYTK